MLEIGRPNQVAAVCPPRLFMNLSMTRGGTFLTLSGILKKSRRISKMLVIRILSATAASFER
jgi:hypothetical protein